MWEENRVESAGRDGLEVVRTFRVDPYTARQAVIDTLLGGVRMIAGRLVRLPPARDSWYPWCYCVDVKTSPFEVLNSPGININFAQLLTLNYSQSAKLVATFKTLNHEEGTGGNEADEKTIATETWDFAAQQLTLPNLYWKWETDNELLVRTDTGVTKTFPRIEYGLTRHFCINIPQNAINQLIGRVNKSSFLVKRNGTTYTRNAQCVRFDGANINWQHTNKGIQFAEISYKFAVNKIYEKLDTGQSGYVTWNRLYRAEKAWWEKPKPSSGEDRSIYLLDEDAPSQTIQGREVKGFDLLFNPAAT